MQELFATASRIQKTCKEFLLEADSGNSFFHKERAADGMRVEVGFGASLELGSWFLELEELGKNKESGAAK
jgi:hypothetical protein